MQNEADPASSFIVIRYSSFRILLGAGMFLARVTGHVVATQKDKTLNGQVLFIVEPLNVRYDETTNEPASLGPTGRAIVALDTVGAGDGQLVLVAQGSSARMTEQTKNLPADAVIVGIVDSAEYAGKAFYKAT
jgi:ethanolamine utilization protein EutN